MSEASADASQREHGRKAGGQLVVTSGDASTGLEPAEQSLDDVALAIAGSAERPRAARLGLAHALALRDHRTDAAPIAVMA